MTLVFKGRTEEIDGVMEVSEILIIWSMKIVIQKAFRTYGIRKPGSLVPQNKRSAMILRHFFFFLSVDKYLVVPLS